MTERDAFLRTILEDPLEDVPRLIFADWLEEQGEGLRAEAIRVGCALKSMGQACAVCAKARRKKCSRKVKKCQRVSWQEREWQLYGGGGVVRVGREDDGLLRSSPSDVYATVILWPDFFALPVADAREEPRRFEPTETAYRFSRGFVETIDSSTAYVLNHAKRIFSSQPVLYVRLTDRHRWSRDEDGRMWHHLTNIDYPAEKGFHDWALKHSGYGIHFGSFEEGMAAIERCCVHWGRHLAGLPPLMAVGSYNESGLPQR